MSQNLRKHGLEVVGYDVSEERRNQVAAETGMPVVSSIAEATKDVDFIVTSVPETRHVEEVLKSEGGVFASAKKGTYICDTSTISPEGSKQFYEEAKKHGLVYLDTPVSGAVVGAQNATLSFMVGGEKEEFEHAKKVMEGMGANFFHMGGPGTGSVTKLANNLILGNSMIVASEGLQFGAKLGVDPALLNQVLIVSSARCWSLDTYNPVPGVIPNTPASRDYENGFQVALVRKDLGLALDAAKTGEDVLLDMTEKSWNMYKDLETKGYGRKDMGFAYQSIMKSHKL